MSTISKYKLTIAKSEADTDIINLGGSDTQSNLIKNNFAGTQKVMLTATDWNFDIQMFQPGHIALTLSLLHDKKTSVDYVTLDSVTVQQLYLGGIVTLSYDVTESAKTNTVYVAQDYFVYNADVVKSDDDPDNLVLYLDIYSKDKMLDLQPMSAAYTAKTISSIANDYIAAANEQVGTTDARLTFSSATQLQLLNVRYTDDKKNTASVELKLPYLVQHNESVYSFLSRVLARTGEFMYWEDGKLNIGLNAINETSPTTIQVGSSNNKCKSYQSDNSKFNLLDSTTATPSQRVGNDSFIEPLEVKKDAGDPVLEFITKGAIFTEGWGNAFSEAHGYREIFALLRTFAAGQKSCPDVVCSLLLQQLWTYPLDVMNREYYNKIREYNKTMVPVNSNYTEHSNYEVDEFWQESDTNLSPFSMLASRLRALTTTGYYKLDSLSEEYYDTIYKAASKVANGEVTIDIDNNDVELKLGSVVTFGFLTGKYMVVAIKGTIHTDDDGTIKYVRTISAIPMSQLSSGEDVFSLWLPKPLTNRVVKADGPVIGFVSETHDPLEMGRVRVRMAWQKKGDNINATPWIRTAMPMAGEKGNIFMQPGVGDEVIVDFEDGNMERPYVNGSLYNAEHKLVRAPANAVSNGSTKLLRYVTTGAGSGLFIEDETMTFNDMVGQILPGLGSITSAMDIPDYNKFNSDVSLPLGAKISLKDYYGTYEMSMSSKERKVNISSHLGQIDIKAFTGIGIKAPNADINIKGKNVNITAGNTLKLNSGANITEKRGKTAGGVVFGVISKIVITISDKVLGPKVIDLSLIRSATEVVLRPINGTMTIKSNRHLALEAGKGKAEIPYDSIKMTAKAGAINTVNESYPYHLLLKFYQDTDESIKLHGNDAVNAYNRLVHFMKYKSRPDNEDIDVEENPSAESYEMLSSLAKTQLSQKKCKHVLSLVNNRSHKYRFNPKDKELKELCPIPNDKKYKKDKEPWLKAVKELGSLYCNYCNAMSNEAIATKIGESMTQLVQSKNRFTPKIADFFDFAKYSFPGVSFDLMSGETKLEYVNSDNISDIINKYAGSFAADNFGNSIHFTYNMIKALIKFKIVSYVGAQEQQTDGSYAENKPCPEFNSVFSVTDAAGDNDETGIDSQTAWNKFLDHLVPYFEDSKKDGVLDVFVDSVQDFRDTELDINNVKALEGIVRYRERSMWDAKSNPGNILMSDQKGTYTARLDDYGQLQSVKNASVEAILDAIREKAKI